MAKNQNRALRRKERRAEKRRNRREYLEQQRLESMASQSQDLIQDYRTPIVKKPLEARTESQAHYIISIESNQITFASGPAGTGKTYVCGSLAAEALMNGDCQKIVITRPMVEAEEDIGYLPGTLEEKFAPYFTPFREVLEERLGVGHVKALITAGRIEMAPLAYMRGRSFKNCFVVLDEAQNTTPGQMKLFLTRLGEDCKVVINGDLDQKDIHGKSGLEDGINTVASRGIRGINHIEFDTEDSVRSPIVREIIAAYEDRNNFGTPTRTLAA